MADIFNPEFKSKLKENPSKINELLNRDGIEFYFFPSTELKELVSKNEHPIIRQMPKSFRMLILSGKAHAIAKKLIRKILLGELDEKNSFILSKGDIRIAGDNITLMGD